MKKRITGLLLCTVLLSVWTAAGCTKAVQTEEAEETAEEMPAEPKTEEITEEIKEEEPEDTGLLDYVDAWGESHTMEVNRDVAKSIYEAGKFMEDPEHPQRITYDDPAFTVLQGIDVSEYQGEIDWEEVAASGCSFVFVRLGYRGYGEKGVLCEDKRADGNLQGAKEAGLRVGAYFFSQALTEEEAREEAELSLKILDRSGVALDLPLMYDPELIRGDEGRANDITRDQVALNTAAFLKRVREEEGLEADIYSNLPWEDTLFDGDTLNACQIWYADYEKQPQTPYHFIWWQYSNQGEVPGIEGAVDLDLWILQN